MLMFQLESMHSQYVKAALKQCIARVVQPKEREVHQPC